MFRFEWLGLAMLVVLTVGMREPARQTSPHEDAEVSIRCEPAVAVERRSAFELGMERRASALRVADAQYRNGQSALAATTIHDAVAFDPELQALSELYAAFADESATIASPTTPTTDLFVALRRGQALDMALGGAFAEALNARMRDVAPRAVAAYTRAHDRAGAELATHTAELFK